MLCLQAAQTACAADASSCPFRCTTISAPACSSGHSLTPEARQQWRLALQVPSDCRLRKNCSDRVDRSRDRLCAAPPLNLSAQRHSQRQHEPQTETEGGGGHCGRGWAGAPPFGGGSSGWRRSNDDDGDEDVDAHALDPFRRHVLACLRIHRGLEQYSLPRANLLQVCSTLDCTHADALLLLRLPAGQWWGCRPGCRPSLTWSCGCWHWPCWM